MNPIDCTGIEVSALDGAMRAWKRPVEVRVVFAASDGVLETLEGNVRYRSGDALVQGGHRDQWPVGRARFDADYRAVAGSHDRYVKRPVEVWAKPMDRPFQVRAGGSSDVLTGEAGDWLVEYRRGEYGVVQRDVFEATYALSG